MTFNTDSVLSVNIFVKKVYTELPNLTVIMRNLQLLTNHFESE